MTARPPRVDERSHVAPRRPDGSRGRRGPHLGPIAITAPRVTLAIAIVGSLAFIAFGVLAANDSAQLPMVTSGLAILGLSLAALSIGSAIQMWRSWQDGSQGRTIVLAIFGGLCGAAALGAFAGALVFALVLGSSPAPTP
jgi:hypothetical protein